jgi:signal transduction histidine kinase/ActR/RegA family two-component response regulator
MGPRHSLLQRQLRRTIGEGRALPPEVEALVAAVDEAYAEFDDDRRMLERSLDLSSQELLQANSELRTLLQAIPDFFFRLAPDGTILDSRAGPRRDQERYPVGRRLQDVPSTETAAKLEGALERARRTGALASVEYGLTVAGHRLVFEARILPLRGDQLVALVRDVTERRHLEDEQLKTGKLESISQLAGGIAHDFNNILTSIMGNVSLARQVLSGRADVQDMLGDTEKAALRARKLVKQLLAFSRGGAAVKRSVELGEVVREATHFALRGANVRCVFEEAGPLRTVHGDEGQLGQLVDNLVINAKQAMPGGGVIRIGVANCRVEEDDPALAGILPPGDYLRVTVADAGVGIAEEHLQRIFDPYFTTKQNGVGLGLATSLSIVKRHDGHIGVASELGVGTTVTIHLPAAPEPAPRDREALRPRSGRGRVLVMDDEDVVLQVVRKMLEHLGCTVATARGVEEAVREYRLGLESGARFDAVLVDVTIPGGPGGQEALRQLQALDPEVRAIVSSGYAEEPILADFQRYGFRGAIPKPYRIEDLAQVLEAVLPARPSPPGP